MKPLSELSPAYRTRIERAEARGLSRQSARGHKAGEHIERKRREKSLGGLTSSQRQSVRKFAARQSFRDRGGHAAYPSEALLADQMIEWTLFNGYDKFSRLRDFVYREHRRSKGKNRRVWPKGSKAGIEWLETRLYDIVGNTAFDDNFDIEWLYYH